MVVKISLTEKVTLQQRLEKGEAVDHGRVWGRAMAEPPRQECANMFQEQHVGQCRV